jgi:small-conductance mechanosensitive channel
VVLGAGWLVARMLRWLFSRITLRIGRMVPGSELKRELRDSAGERVAADVVGHVVFWIVFLLFVAAASQVLGLQAVTAGLTRLAQYLPSVLAAVVIVVAGVMLSNVARRATARAVARAGIAQGETLGQAARVLVLIVAIVVALDQVGIESTLLILTLAILLGTVVGSAALAFALGAREAVSGLIAVHYLERFYRPGDRVGVGEIEGRIVEFSGTAVILDTNRGRAIVPAAEFRAAPSFRVEEDS